LASIAGIETGARPGGVVTSRERVTMAKTPAADSIAAELVGISSGQHMPTVSA
jgi:hypothetical protein